MNPVYGYKPKSKNGRWPWPTLHVFTWEWSQCGKIRRDDDRLIVSEKFPEELVVPCELCAKSRPKFLRDFFDRQEK